ncbi:hypothetical protein G7Y89_g10076 [Cudoniella acicularis]|uniref:60S ribosomal protein L41 n=1 Tax=Cudoniella acicularis TaxID=354080 RepID=A0A8H4REH1_9HELO|nr:hypothetical protein G7Y89_g10076 [Cudoniella acicularis]
MFHLDYNSSDNEDIFVQDDNSYSHLGMNLAEKMLENPVDDRKRSKQLFKNQKPKTSSPVTNQEYARWWNRWVVYVGTIGISKDGPPSFEAVERFLITITDNACRAHAGHGASGVPSFGWLQRGCYCVVTGFQFRHPEWQPGPGTGARLRGIMRTLLAEGKLTKDPIRIKQWITTRLTIQLAIGYITHSLESDVTSWDVIFSRMLSWVLQSAVDGRAGDVTLSTGYSTHFLKWEDLQMQLDPEGTVEGLTIKVTLRNSKNAKDDPARNTIKLIDHLQNKAFNVADPVNLLLVHGIRTGVFVESTLQEILSDAATHDDASSSLITARLKGETLKALVPVRLRVSGRKEHVEIGDLPTLLIMADWSQGGCPDGRGVGLEVLKVTKAEGSLLGPATVFVHASGRRPSEERRLMQSKPMMICHGQTREEGIYFNPSFPSFHEFLLLHPPTTPDPSSCASKRHYAMRNKWRKKRVRRLKRKRRKTRARSK